MDFGEVLKELRSRRGVGIKRLAPEVGVSYTYLSKLEKGGLRPSAEVVERIARYFEYDPEALLVVAGWIPRDILQILRDNPDDALEFLRERFGRNDSSRSKT